MNKNDKTKKEKFCQNNIENTSNTTPKIQNINTNNTISQHSRLSIHKKEETEPPINNINKPKELRELDTLTHLKHNIIYYEKNCSDPITEYSYYCFTCKKSICYKCGLGEHKDHILIQRNNCLNYDHTFFNEISKVIENSLLTENNKSDIKNKISNSINEIKNSLDNLKNHKFKIIDGIFNKLKNNILELQNNYLKTKKTIEDYYSINKEFFNVKVEKANNGININNLNKNGIFQNIDISYNDNSTNNKNNYINTSSNEILIKNKDIENTVFLLNFDLMNFCDNKNIEILNFTNDIKNKISLYLEEIDKRTILIQKYILQTFDIPLDIDKLEDFYKEVNSRAIKFSEHINQFKETICEIVKKTSNLEKIKDLINILESKNNKGKNQIFEQKFFKTSNIKTENNEKMKIRQNSKNKKLKRGVSGDFKKIKNIVKIETDTDTCINNLKTNLFKEETSKNKKNSISPFKIEGKLFNNSKKKKIYKTNSFYEPNKNNIKPLNPKEIILNQRILQKFFSYATHSFYSKNYFRPKTKENIEKINEKENNKNISVLKNIKNKGESLIKTVSYLANYTQRYNKLKEQAKPIIGTNQIQLYDLNTKKIIKKILKLTKEDHGYTQFPEGCRHILLKNNLYITGGTDMYGVPINIVLLYNVQNNTITKINNLIDNHSYHTLEYLEKYDCIILIGGENSSSCEIMDMDLNKWFKLPSLNYPRANLNIFFNFITNDLFALFGINGDISNNKMKYSDIIEVIEMNDITKGWAKVDYYKGSGFNLKSKYCMTLPFTKDKLLIYGVENMRNENKNLFALFDMNKNECIKVDKITLEQIKLEEKKIRLFDLALNKMNFDN